MSFRKQVEECGERIDHHVLHLSSFFWDFGKVICMACDPNFSPDGRSIFNTHPPGTDLNRNFPCAWGEGVGTGTWLQGSSLPFWETYIGEDHFLLKSLIFLFYLRGCTGVRTGDQGNDGLSPPASEWYWGENFSTARVCKLIFLPFVNFYWQKISLQAYLAIHSFGNLVIHPSPYSQKVGSVTTYHYNYNFVKNGLRQQNVWFSEKLQRGVGVIFNPKGGLKAVWNFS